MRRLLTLIGFMIFTLLKIHGQTPRLNWVKNLGVANQITSGISILLDSNKAVVTGGLFYSTLDFDAGAATFNLTSGGNQDVFITKYDTAGAFIWAKRIGGAQDDYLRDIKFDRNGNLLVLCYLQGIVDLDPGPAVVNSPGSGVVLLKLDNSGNFIWSRYFQLTSMNNLDVDMGNSILLSGYFSGTRDFDPGPGVYNATASSPQEDLFILKLDNAGNFAWMKQMNNVGNNWTHEDRGLETDANNNIYLGGWFAGNFDFDPGPSVFSLTTDGSNDAFVVKLNAQGDFQWARKWGGTGSEGVRGLEVDAAGNVYTTGGFTNTVDFDPGPGSYVLVSPGARACFISKLDNQGNFAFARHFTGDSFGQGIALDSSGNIYVSGSFHGTADFDPGPAIYNLSTGHLFTAKLFPDGSFGWVAGFIAPAGFFESVYSAIAVDVFKNVYYTGSFPYTLDFDPTVTTHNVTAKGLWDVPIVKLSQCQSINNISAAFCGSYTLNNITYTDTGTFYQVLPTGVDCDSIIVLHLTRDDKRSQINAAACGYYKWSGDSLTASGIYRDTVHLPNNCDSIIELHLTVHPLPQPALGRDTSLCTNSSIVLNPGSFNSYAWSDGSTLNTLTVSLPGMYWVNVTDNNSCSARDSIIVGAGFTGTADLGPDRTKCNNDTLHLAAPAGFMNYTWTNNNNASTLQGQQVIVNPLTNMVYYLKAEKMPGCFAYDTIGISVNQSPVISLGNDTSFCQGQNIQLNAGSGFAIYVWNTSSTAQAITVNSAGMYSITATTVQGCKSLDTLVVISVYPNPQVNLDQNNQLCAGTVRILDAGTFAGYLWHDGSTNRTFTVSGPGDYSLKVWDNNGCTATGSTSITQMLAPPAAFLPKDTLLCTYSNMQLTSLQNFNQYLWNTGGLSSSITINTPGLFWLQVTDAKGCKGKDSILVQSKECRRGLFVPNAFSPDGNRVNDQFKALLYGPVKYFEITVYNRWGQVVFRSSDRLKGWDGTVAGTKQDSNVFVWICKYQFEGEQVKVEKGSVVLVR